MRIVGLDVGERRIGVAVSDATGTLARPVGVLKPPAGLDSRAVELVSDEVQRLNAGEEEIASIVIGLPKHLDGTPSGMTALVERFAAQLGTRIGLPIVMQDERLTSREAESRLALFEKDWRVRKKRLDAAAAAIVLQDYLDTRPGRPVPTAPDAEF